MVSRLGLRFEDDRLKELAHTLVRRADAQGRLPEAYLDELETRAGSAELRTLSNELTVAETYFFRNVEQMRALVEIALPARARALGHRPVRILSAGCASGDEAYSLAILASEELIPAGHAVSIHGIDLNPVALERARSARYSGWALRETPPNLRSRYFRTEGRDFVLDESVREMVTFEERNLLAEDAAFWRDGAFDVVFCRNVLMYFAPEAARAVVARLTSSLVDEGFLFLGYAETMRGLSQSFHLRHTHETFYYQRRHPDLVEPTTQDASQNGAAGPTTGTRVGLPSGVLDASWIETIRRASERIAALTATSEGTDEVRSAAPPAPRPRREFDVGPAVDLIAEERFDDAFALLASLPPHSSRDPDVLLLRAVLSTHGGDLGAAESLCREVILLDEMSAGAHYLLALCREDAGDRASAVEHDRVASYLDPTFAMPLLHLGLLARRAGDHAAARSTLGDAVKLLEREDPSRLLLYGGGFRRSGLIALCRAELHACGGPA